MPTKEAYALTVGSIILNMIYSAWNVKKGLRKERLYLSMILFTFKATLESYLTIEALFI